MGGAYVLYWTFRGPFRGVAGDQSSYWLIAFLVGGAVKDSS